jgi:DNA polymerase-3 subunit gamma/tau
VVALDGNTLTLGFTNVGARDSFVGGGCDEVLRQAAIDVVGADWKIDAIVDAGAQPDSSAPVASSTPAPPESRAEQPPAAEAPPAWADDEEPEEPPTASSQAAREAIRETRAPGKDGAPERPDLDADAHPDDPRAEDVTGTEMIQRTLGAEIIEEIRHT